MSEPTINDVFERVIVLNLDRRPDRIASLGTQLEHLGIGFERFAAIDGEAPTVAAEWQAYAGGAVVDLPADLRPVTDYREFYLDYESDRARVAFVESKDRAKAIATPGAWGLLASMTAIVERALAEGWESVLVLEDDVLWHRNSRARFGRAIEELPADWQILQLGAMQLHWDASWIDWCSDHLYRCNGSSIGAHAFGVRREVLPLLLERCRARDLPFDIGALHTAKRRFADRCFTLFPNLAIQDAADSDIGSSRLFFREARQVDNIYRWHLPDYGLEALRESGADVQEPAVAADDSPSVRIEPTHTSAAASLAARTLPHFDRLKSLLFRQPSGSGKPASAGERAANPAPDRKKPAATRKLGGQPPLKAHQRRRPDSQPIVVVAVGLGPDPLASVLDTLCATRDREKIEPIVITDCDRFELLRDRNLVFEYLPPPDQRRLAADLDWDLYLVRRLALIRRKWQPIRIVSFGPAAGQLLSAWRQSPFEDDSIHQVTGGPVEAL